MTPMPATDGAPDVPHPLPFPTPTSRGTPANSSVLPRYHPLKTGPFILLIDCLFKRTPSDGTQRVTQRVPSVVDCSRWLPRSGTPGQGANEHKQPPGFLNDFHYFMAEEIGQTRMWPGRFGACGWVLFWGFFPPKMPVQAIWCFVEYTVE